MLFKLSKFIDQLLTKVEHIYKTTTNSFNPLECNGNYSATSNNMKLVQVNQAAARPGPSSIRSVARGGGAMGAYAPPCQAKMVRVVEYL